jgi:hypothetical protein
MTPQHFCREVKILAPKREIEGCWKAQILDWEDRGKIQDPNSANDYPHYDPEIDSNFSGGSPEIR